MDFLSFWINPVLVVGGGSLLWRFLVKRFDRIDLQFRDLNRQVAANGRSIARIEGRHEGHPAVLSAAE